MKKIAVQPVRVCERWEVARVGGREQYGLRRGRVSSGLRPDVRSRTGGHFHRTRHPRLPQPRLDITITLNLEK